MVARRTSSPPGRLAATAPRRLRIVQWTNPLATVGVRVVNALQDDAD
jgi:hypothetical protein